MAGTCPNRAAATRLRDLDVVLDQLELEAETSNSELLATLSKRPRPEPRTETRLRPKNAPGDVKDWSHDSSDHRS